MDAPTTEIATLTRRYKFAASHRLHSECLPVDENARIFGKCNNPNGHGHNYQVYVSVRGPIEPQVGRVTDLEALDRIVTETIVNRFDHRDLNLDPAFSGRTTTGENVTRLIWDLLAAKIPGDALDKVGLLETRDNYFEYSERQG
ncbi:MAG TPA: 6-carboxytetrahydropterin synthase [Nitrospiraceae bacterium]|nr:6-carboxytetrahydropterin synthase [Nitrospiraceae bacterium]